ncbi:hypothetical protein [Sulfitobacter sp. PS-8MA]|uniref:hypothetical protein n=1 Tax=Sulfitobacter sp. PS-8MA TaxID=3237707 RepID=UPI0034C6385B
MPQSPQDPRTDFAQAFPAHVGALVRLLTVLRREFDGDLDLLLICAIVGERHFARRIDPATPTYKTLGATPVTKTPSVNAYSIAQYSGIPRETVRRKVSRLVDNGWLRVDGKGNFSPTAKAAEDLMHGTQETVRFLKDVSPYGGSLSET